MTDLEDLWADYPTSPPPVDALLRKARAEARVRRRRRVVRPLLVGLAAASVASAFVVGDHLAGTGNPDRPTAGGAGANLAAPALRNSAFRADLHPATSCAQLLASYRDRALDQVSAWGWNYGGWGVVDGVRAANVPLAASAAADSGKAASGSALGSVGNSATGTNVQEAGVDEPDEVKTDGSLLVRAQGATLSVYDVTGPTVTKTADLTLPDLSGAQLLLHGTTVVALGSDTAASAHSTSGTRVETVSLADPAHPVVTAQVRYSGGVESARQHGSVVRLVLADDLPSLPFVHPHRGLSRQDALERNRAIVADSTLDDWLPRYDDGNGSRPLLACDQVALPPSGVPLGTESIAGFHLADPAKPTAIGIAGWTDVAYESADHLYLTSGSQDLCIRCLHPLASGVAASGSATGVASSDAETEPTTTIFQLDLHGTAASHVATGRVSGTIADRWSMDEAGGILRVAVSHGEGKDRASAVVTMRPDGATLAEVGRLDGLGTNETLTAARWFDDLAILSTARRTDPLFTVDLGDPAHPKLLGALHIPGYTTYFHPLGHGQLLGIGQKVAFEQGSGDEKEQAQVGLFDINDLTDVHQLAVTPLQQWTWPMAAADPHAFTWLADRSTAITSFTDRHGRVLLGTYRVSDDTMTQQLTPLSVRGGVQVRSLELPSGRVVLIAGDQVSFLAL